MPATSTKAPAPRTVVLLNSYSMHRAFALWQAGESQAHHVWGLSALGAAGGATGPRVVFDDTAGAAPSRHETLWRRVGLARNTRLQLSFLWAYRRADVVYAATYSVARVLGVARRLGLFRPRIVALAHFPLRRNPVDRVALGGIDRLLYLSRQTQRITETSYPSLAAKAEHMGWAVDLEFYDRQLALRPPPPSQAGAPLRIVAAGKDHRDYVSFVEGVAQVRRAVAVEIYCSQDVAPPAAVPWVAVQTGGAAANPLTIQQLVDHYGGADVIAIPLQAIDRVAGLTSLLDALALGRPVLCTRNAGLDIDIEAIGCGRWVEPGDARAWAAAIDALPADPAERQAMGQRGRRFAEQHLDLARYEARLVALLRACMGDAPGAE